LAELVNKNNIKPILTGITAYPGLVKGNVLMIIDPLVSLKQEAQGMIVVAKYLTPVAALKVLKAKAIICEQAGLTSHAAVVARDYAIPCIVGVKEALNIIQENDVLVVDADKGEIYRK